VDRQTQGMWQTPPAPSMKPKGTGAGRVSHVESKDQRKVAMSETTQFTIEQKPAVATGSAAK